MQGLKLSRKWKAAFPRTRTGEDSRAEGIVMRKLERRRREKYRLKSETMEIYSEKKNEQRKMHLELKIRYGGGGREVTLERTCPRYCQER